MTDCDFLVDDMKLKLAYLEGQYSRLWQRLSYFLTIEAALFGAYGWLAFDKSLTGTIWLLGLAGVVISVLWYLVSSQDSWLVNKYRCRVYDAAKLVGEAKGLINYEERHPGASVESGFNSFISWYLKPLSITKLPAWISLLLILLWTSLSVFYAFIGGNP